VGRDEFTKRLERALDVAIVELEELKRLGFLTRYDKQPSLEEGIYHLTAYAKDPNRVDRLLGNLSARLSIEFDVPLVIVLSREEDGR
jgi:hypothetical protein